jgi:anti-sigma B factor antagonist
MPFHLEDDRTAVLRLHGDLDFFSEDTFRAEAERLLTGDLDEFIVDLGAVNMVDSSGLSLLVDLLRLCREMGLPMLLRDVPEKVQQIFDLTGLDQVMTADESDLKERGASQ